MTDNLAINISTRRQTDIRLNLLGNRNSMRCWFNNGIYQISNYRAIHDTQSVASPKQIINSPIKIPRIYNSSVKSSGPAPPQSPHIGVASLDGRPIYTAVHRSGSTAGASRRAPTRRGKTNHPLTLC